MTILHDLIMLYNATRPGKIYHDVVHIILQNLHIIPTLTLEETAELCNTSVITINRLLKKIQCPTFRDFKHEIGIIVEAYEKHNRVFPYEEDSIQGVISNYYESIHRGFVDLENRVELEELEKICDVIHQADDVHIYCEFSASHAKQQLQVDLVLSGKHVIGLGDPIEQIEDAQTLTNRSVVITSSQTALKHYHEHQRMIKYVSTTDATVITIASTATPGIAKYSDYILRFKGTETAMDNYYLDAIFNLITLCYRTKYIDNA